MLELTLFEFIFRTIPEAFILVFALFIFSGTKINHRKYVLSSVLFGIIVKSVRMLPINYGVHTILDIFVMIIIMCFVNKSDIVASIKASLLTTIILFVCETLNMFLISYTLQENLESVMSNIKLKIVCGLPSLIFFASIILIYYSRRRKKCYE